MKHAEAYVMCVLAATLAGFCLPFVYSWMSRRVLRRNNPSSAPPLLSTMLTILALYFGSMIATNTDAGRNFTVTLCAAALIGSFVALFNMGTSSSARSRSTPPP